MAAFSNLTELPQWLSRRHRRQRFFLGSGRFPRERNSTPLRYSCLGNPMESGDLWAIVQRVAKSQTPLMTKHSKLHTHGRKPEGEPSCESVKASVRIFSPSRIFFPLSTTRQWRWKPAFLTSAQPHITLRKCLRGKISLVSGLFWFLIGHASSVWLSKILLASFSSSTVSLPKSSPPEGKKRQSLVHLGWMLTVAEF